MYKNNDYYFDVNKKNVAHDFFYFFSTLFYELFIRPDTLCPFDKIFYVLITAP